MSNRCWPFYTNERGKKYEENFDLFVGTEEYNEHLVRSSGKMVLLDKLLPKLKEDGHKVEQQKCLPIYWDDIQLDQTYRMDLVIDNEKVLENYGEVQFTDYGLSGIPIMQLSRFVSMSPSNDIYINLDVTPDFTLDEISNYLFDRREFGTGLCENVLIGVMNKQLCITLLKECGIAPNGKISELSDDEIIKLSKLCKCWIIKIKTARGFDFAQVTAGGADCSQFNSKTMESVLIENLFCCGEALNIDGDCGGYNLQWAWSSGRTAGHTIGERINNAQNQ